MTRQQVFMAIDSEREYQNNLERNIVLEQRPLEYLGLIQVLTQKMLLEFYEKPGQPSMDYMRKIAAVAVRCMEEHGVSIR
jgi:hypothetical protein